MFYIISYGVPNGVGFKACKDVDLFCTSSIFSRAFWASINLSLIWSSAVEIEMFEDIDELEGSPSDLEF